MSADDGVSTEAWLMSGIAAISQELIDNEQLRASMVEIRDQLVREAMQRGMKRTEIAEAAQIGLARLYQIVDQGLVKDETSPEMAG